MLTSHDFRLHSPKPKSANQVMNGMPGVTSTREQLETFETLLSSESEEKLEDDRKMSQKFVAKSNQLIEFQEAQER